MLSRIGRGLFAGLRVAAGLLLIWAGLALFRHDPLLLKRIPANWQADPLFGQAWWIAVLLAFGVGIVLHALPVPVRARARSKAAPVVLSASTPAERVVEGPEVLATRLEPSLAATWPGLAAVAPIVVQPPIVVDPEHVPPKKPDTIAVQQQLRSKPVERRTYRKLFLVESRRPRPN